MSELLPIPPKRELEKLYVEQQLTTIQVGLAYGVSNTTANRWLQSYGIQLRPSGRGLIAQGRDKPTPEELRKLIYDDHQSYEEVARVYGTTRQAVSYWLKMYGIPLAGYGHARRKGIQLPTPEEFLDLYEDQKLSLKEIAQRHQTTRDVITTFCRKNNLSLRNSGFDGGKRYECEDGHTVRSVYEQRVDNWLSQHGIDHSYEPPLLFDKRYHADFLANGWYIEIWGVTKSAPYVKRRLHKTQMYKEHGLPLLEIPEHHFDHRRNNRWERALSSVLKPPEQLATLF